MPAGPPSALIVVCTRACFDGDRGFGPLLFSIVFSFFSSTQPPFYLPQAPFFLGACFISAALIFTLWLPERGKPGAVTSTFGQTRKLSDEAVLRAKANAQMQAQAEAKIADDERADAEKDKDEESDAEIEAELNRQDAAARVKVNKDNVSVSETTPLIAASSNASTKSDVN